MAIDYDVLEYTINALVEKLMSKYDTNYESSIGTVMASELYERLLKDRTLLESGDIYLFALLENELRDKGGNLIYLCKINTFIELVNQPQP